LQISIQVSPKAADNQYELKSFAGDTVKIDNSIKSTGAPAGSRVRPQQQRAETTGAPAISDEVKLSPLAGELQAGDSQPPIDAARVSEIKRAIAEGRFSINAGAIADRLIDTARELVSSQRRA